MIVNKLINISSQPIFYQLSDFNLRCNCFIKLEGFNIAGSIKLKSAIRMISSLENKKILKKNSIPICSSSGNLGVALSIVCKEKGYPFVCVSDPNISPITERYITLWGGKVIKVEIRDENGGFLASRIRLIKKMIKEDERYVFVDQYSDQENANAHYLTTAQEISSSFGKVDYLFIGAGTTGTLNGCVDFFKRFFPETKIIAVDAVGSVTFDKPAARRYIPGLGTSLKPDLANGVQVDDIVWVEELDTIKRCHLLLKQSGLFLGGSSGTVLQAVYQYQDVIPVNSTVVAISPDNGDRYLDTIYNNEWLLAKFNFSGDVYEK